MTNKRDFDFGISIFEQRPDGTYLQLPAYQSRASYVADLSRRRLLTPGKRQVLDLQSIRLASHLCRAGSRIVLVLGVERAQASRSTMERVRTSTMRALRTPASR